MLGQGTLSDHPHPPTPIASNSLAECLALFGARHGCEVNRREYFGYLIREATGGDPYVEVSLEDIGPEKLYLVSQDILEDRSLALCLDRPADQSRHRQDDG